MSLQYKIAQPLKELPVWARLEFAEMISQTYSWDPEYRYRRHSSEAIFEYFVRVGDAISISYALEWENHTTHHYRCSFHKRIKIVDQQTRDEYWNQEDSLILERSIRVWLEETYG